MTTVPLDETAARRTRKKDRSRAPSLEELREGRTVWATMPSGHEFRLRPPTLELHMLSAGLPTSVRRLVGESEETVAAQITDENPEARAAASDYFLHMAKLIVVEPDLSAVETVEELDDLLIPEDFNFLIEISQRTRVRDALNRRMWGLEPLSRWESFRVEHGCKEDCPACAALQRGEPVAEVQ